jgi:hypothetical protein
MPSYTRSQGLLLLEKIAAADRYFARCSAYLIGARKSVTAALIICFLLAGTIAQGPSPVLAAAALVAMLLLLAARHRVARGIDELSYARSTLFHLDNPAVGKPGELISIYAHPDPLPTLYEELIAEVVEDDGRVGRATILSEPRGGVAHIPHGTAPLEVRKGDLVRFHRPGGRTSIGIWAVERSGPPIR